MLFFDPCEEDFVCISWNSSNSIARQEIKAQREEGLHMVT